jgi:putative peptidoglycan lipid II flippase
VLSTGIAAWHGFGINGLPIADGIFYTVQFAVLVWLLRRKVGGLELRGLTTGALRMAVASVVCAGAAWGVARLLAPLADGFGGAALQVAGGGVVGLGLAYAIGRMLRIEELAPIDRLASRLLRRTTARKDV